MKPTFLVPALTAMLLVSCATSRPDVAAKSGLNHPLALGTGAEGWKPSADGAQGSALIPGGLIWRAESQTAGVMLCLHGIQTHSAWFARLARALNDAGWTVIAVDRRGSGVNSGTGYRRGHTTGAAQLLEDLEAQMQAARAEAKGGRVVLVGTSWGSNVASAFALEKGAHGSLPDGLMQLVPATQVRAPHEPGLLGKVPIFFKNVVAPAAMVPLRFQGLHYLAGEDQDQAGRQPLPVVPWEGETAPEQYAAKNAALLTVIQEDQLAETLLLRPTARTLITGKKLHDQWRNSSQAKTPRVPVLVLTAQRDQVTDNAAARAAFQDGSGRPWPNVSFDSIDAGHGVQLTDAAETADKIVRWTGRLR